MDKWVYIREIYNLQLLQGPQDFGLGIELSPLPYEISELMDKTARIGLLGRWQLQYWMIQAEPSSAADYIDGDPSGGLRVLPTALLIMVSPLLKFGPAIHLRIGDDAKELAAIVYDRLCTLLPHCKPDDFIINNNDLTVLRQLFAQLAKNWKASILEISIDRFIRACSDKLVEDAIIDLSIALEYIYLDNDPEKGENIARRAAVFIGKYPPEREEIYVNVRTFYWGRNKIMHKDIVRPTVILKNNRTIDSNQMQYIGFYILSKTFIELLNDPYLLNKTKGQLVSEFKTNADALKAEFDAYKKKLLAIRSA